MVVPGLIALVLGLVVQMMAPKICKKFGTKNTVVACLLACGIGGIAVYFAGWKNFGLVVACCNGIAVGNYLRRNGNAL